MPAPKGHEPYPGCEKGGRPKTYDQEFIENLADELLKWLEQGKFCWFERFALQKGINPDLLSKFASENEKFAGAYGQAKAHQRILLIEGGLMKKFNYNMAHLLLGHHYGIFEKKETHLTGDAANPLAFLMQQVDGKSRDLINGGNEK